MFVKKARKVALPSSARSSAFKASACLSTYAEYIFRYGPKSWKMRPMAASAG